MALYVYDSVRYDEKVLPVARYIPAPGCRNKFVRLGTSVAWFIATPARISAKNSLGLAEKDERTMP